MAGTERIAFIREMVLRGGPVEQEYEDLKSWYVDVMADHASGRVSPDDLRDLWDVFGEAATPKTLQGFVARTPHGYHGDWEIIDKMYTHWVTPEPMLRRWDVYFQDRCTCKAVRNRPSMLDRQLADIVSERGEDRIAVLVVGCGPARDIEAYCRNNPDQRIRFTCVDLDPSAIRHASVVCAPWLERIEFRVGNALRELPPGPFDLVWATGLFDYFNDRVFTFMLRRLHSRLARGGRMSIGNFSTSNPHRAEMEFFGWNLHHRSETQLLALAADANPHSGPCDVVAEDEGINLFLQVGKD